MVIYDIQKEEFVDSVEIEMSEKDFENYFGRIVELYNTPAFGNDEFWGDEDNAEMQETYIETIFQKLSNLKDMDHEFRNKLTKYENTKSGRKSAISKMLDFIKGK